MLVGIVNYTVDKFSLTSADLDVVTRNRLLRNTDFHAFLKSLVPKTIQEVKVEATELEPLEFKLQHVMGNLQSVQIDANMDGIWTSSEIVDTLIQCQTTLL